MARMREEQISDRDGELCVQGRRTTIDRACTMWLDGVRKECEVTGAERNDGEVRG